MRQISTRLIAPTDTTGICAAGGEVAGAVKQSDRGGNRTHGDGLALGETCESGPSLEGNAKLMGDEIGNAILIWVRESVGSGGISTWAQKPRIQNTDQNLNFTTRL